MKKKRKTEEIESEKSVIIDFPPNPKNPKTRTLGLVQEMAFSEKEIVMIVKPIVVKACFEGDNIRLGMRRKDIKKLMEEIKKFESSKHEVLFITERKTSVYSKKEFNRILESMLQKMVTTKYRQELTKALKKGYIA